MCALSTANGGGKQRKGDRSEPIQYGRLSYECPWPYSAFTSGTECAAGIKKTLCKVRTPASTEKKIVERFLLNLKMALDQFVVDLPGLSRTCRTVAVNSLLPHALTFT